MPDDRQPFLSLRTPSPPLAALGALALSCLVFFAILLSRRAQPEPEPEPAPRLTAVNLPEPPPPPPARRAPPDLSTSLPFAAFETSEEPSYTPISVDTSFQAAKPDVQMDFAFDENLFRPQEIEWSPDHVFDTSEIDEPPQLVYHSGLTIPPRLAKTLEADNIVLMYIVNRDGRVERPYVLNANSPEFAQAVIQSIQKWRFQPGTKDGEPAHTLVRQRIRLTQGNDSPFSR